MELPALDSFVDHWHAAVGQALQDEESRSQLDGQAANLKRVLRADRSLRNLATNPLLGAMICAIHRDRQEELPTDRIELYEACCHALIERRDIERKVDLGDYPTLGYRQKRALLQDLALWLMVNGRTEVEIERADKRLAGKLEAMRGVSEAATGVTVRRLLLERTGIVREPLPGSLDFTHRTFQEYLAAGGALAADMPGLLVDRAIDGQWRDAVILAVGMANKEARETIIRGLLKRGLSEPKHRHQLHLLAVASLETPVELEPEIEAEVSQTIASLVPPRGMRDAKALASAGELAIPFLKPKPNTPGAVAAACVRTLSLIGGEGAFEALKPLAVDPKVPVATELIRAWPNFDWEAYDTGIVTPLCETVQGLRMARLGDWWPIAKRPKPRLERLSFSDFNAADDFDVLGDLPSLRWLELAYNRRIAGLAGLSRTAPVCVQISGFGALRNLTFDGCDEVRLLCIWGCLEANIEELIEFKAITYLSLQNGPIDNLNPIISLRSLNSLTLMGLNKIDDLTPLMGLPSLNSARLWGVRRDAKLPDPLPAGWEVIYVSEPRR